MKPLFTPMYLHFLQTPTYGYHNTVPTRSPNTISNFIVYDTACECFHYTRAIRHWILTSDVSLVHNSVHWPKGLALFICVPMIRNLIRRVNSSTANFDEIDLQWKMQGPRSLQIPLHLSHCPAGERRDAKCTKSPATCVTNVLLPLSVSEFTMSFVRCFSHLKLQLSILLLYSMSTETVRDHKLRRFCNSRIK